MVCHTSVYMTQCVLMQVCHCRIRQHVSLHQCCFSTDAVCLLAAGCNFRYEIHVMKMEQAEGEEAVCWGVPWAQRLQVWP